MRQEKLGFGVIIRMLVSLIPILFGMPIIAVLLCAYNLVMSYVVFGPLTCTVSSLCAMLISMLLYGFSFGDGAQITGLFMALISILCAMGCMQCIRRRVDFFSGVWIASLCALVPLYIWIDYISNEAGLSVSAYFSATVGELFNMAGAIVMEQVPAGMGITQESFNVIAEYAAALAGVLVPGFVIVLSVFIGYVTMWAVNAQLKKTLYPIRHKFSHIRIPLPMSLMLILGIVISYLNLSGALNAVALNVSVIISVFCLAAGISFVEYYLQKSNIRTFLRVMIHFFILNSSLGMAAASPLLNAYTGYVALAVLDSLFNFRKIGIVSEKGGDDNETKK